MLGCRNGFAMQIKNHIERDFIFLMHCCAHRLELAYKESCKEVALFKIFDARPVSVLQKEPFKLSPPKGGIQNSQQGATDASES